MANSPRDGIGRRLYLPALLLPALAAAALLAVATGGPSPAATQEGAAADMRAGEQVCLPDGSVQVRFEWTPSGLGQQWLDLSTVDDNFVAPFETAAALDPGASSFTWQGLQPLTAYFVRVNTLTPDGWMPSETLAVFTADCGSAFTPPSGLQATPLSGAAVRFSWDRGVNNSWFCVDTALNPQDLVQFSGSWANHGCGTTVTEVPAAGLQCPGTYYWRVYAVGFQNAGHSDVATVTLSDCAAASEPAPIESAEVRSVGPNQYQLDVVAGLPGGCTQPGWHTVTREALTVHVAVINQVEPSEACTLAYGTYMLNIPLGSSFIRGAAYSVDVNGYVVSFTPQ